MSRFEQHAAGPRQKGHASREDGEGGTDMDAMSTAAGQEIQREQATVIAVIERVTGFTLASFEVAMNADGTVTRLKVEAKSHKRWIVAHSDEFGRACVERFVLGRDERKNVRRFDGIPMAWEFIGRTQCEGARSALRSFANYIADNATNGAARLEVRTHVGRLLRSFEP